MQLTLIINSLICLAGAVLGLLFAVGSIISIANMTVPWREWLIGAALLVPVTFVVSGIGAWLAYQHLSTSFAIGLIALPWLYAVIFILLMLISF